jgi:secreted trypsin-like serine protease
MLGRDKRWGAFTAAAVAAAVMMPQAAHGAGRIVGGGPAPAGAYPWVVALVFADTASAKDGQYCGGDLISDRLVVTAAHCASFLRSARDVDVVDGIYDLSANDGERIKVDGVAIHPAYDGGTNQNDVAVLRLETPSTRGRPIAVAGPLDAPLFETGDPARALGWGTLHDPDVVGGVYTPNRLFEVDVAITSDLDCEKAYGGAYYPSSMICAGAPGKDTCYGDSGGPLMAPADSPAGWILIGITSWGQGCAREGFPGVYSRVASLRSFVSGPLLFAPYNIEPPAITGTPAVGRNLTCGTGTWANGPTDYAYEWVRRYVAEGFDEPIAGATSPTYRVTAADAGQMLVCLVTASNAGGSGLAESSPVNVPAA